jgi:hypothetical protein
VKIFLSLSIAFILGSFAGFMTARSDYCSYDLYDYFTYYEIGCSVYEKIYVNKLESKQSFNSIEELSQSIFLTSEESKVLKSKKFGSPVFGLINGELRLYHQPGTFGGITRWPHSADAVQIFVDVPF